MSIHVPQLLLGLYFVALAIILVVDYNPTQKPLPLNT